MYLIFPNTILLVREAAVMHHSLFPSGADRTLWRSSAMQQRLAHTPEDEQRLEQDKERAKATQAEDFRAASSIQRGLPAGANSALTFGRFEAGLVRFHRALDEFCHTRTACPGVASPSIQSSPDAACDDLRAHLRDVRRVVTPCWE